MTIKITAANIILLQWWKCSHNQLQNINLPLIFNETTGTQTATTGSNTCSVSSNRTMTFEEFQSKVRRKTSFDKYWYYFISISVLIISLVLLFFIITRPDKFSGSHGFHYAGFIFLLLLGSYGLYVLPNRYKIIRIDSMLSQEAKELVIQKLLEDYGVLRHSKGQQYLFFTIRKKFWNTPYEVHLFYDKTGFGFSVQGQDMADGGFIDFGGTERKRREIGDKIREYTVMEMPAANTSLLP